jgi:tetraacyldisaccharide 4'-kinase
MISKEKIEDVLYKIAWPLSYPYSKIMNLRQFFYQKDLLRQHKLKVPVISIGNLTMGGTGKTPMTLYLARFFQNNSKKVVVLSRGYGGKSSDDINIVSDGKQIFMSAQDAGDEPRMMAEQLPGVSIITGKKRAVTGKYAVSNYKPDVIILDDGFQHLAVKRELDIVLFNSSGLLGNGRVFPGGPLRESIDALKRAGAFVITGVEDSGPVQVSRFKKFLLGKFPDIPIFSAAYHPVGMKKNTGEFYSLSDKILKTYKYHAFCGLATPQAFKKTLNECNLDLSGFTAFQDHYSYGEDDLNKLCRKAIQGGANALVTTEKDLVKISDFKEFSIPVFTLCVELRPELGLSELLRVKFNTSG